ncbi:hypothetical protein [Novipirellula artificiosorum]|uniref:Uncharacterized protein n=1 Tax=Novipirellula artificiosorum TaxID=2528016 RepID=A0A5C6CGR3_9BACT|nr:hypothetical protein [Novipirellula artificiosorum]TWU23508.1 hypothetical protein Poly41_71080 [Novipirellula artificiosorum]
MSRTFFAIVIHLSLALPCLANNSFFIPGDAFFYFEIDQAEWGALQSRKLSVMKYDRPEELSFMLCGYAGYENLDIANLPEEYWTRIVEAIATMKKKYPTKIVEIDHGETGSFGGPSGVEKKEVNKIRVFVCNKSFDFGKHRIALKYNESWPEAGVALGLRRDHFQYDFFVASAQAIVESWRMGADVRPLSVQLPTSGRIHFKEPMKFDPAEVKFLVCPPEPLSSLCFPPRDSDLKCFSVSKDGTTTLTVDKSKKSIWTEGK